MEVDIHSMQDLPPVNQDQVVSFCAAAWNKTFRDFRPPAVELPTYWTWNNKLVRHLLLNQDTVIATWPDSPELFVGFACGSQARGLLHYCYVKGPLRRQGVATQLVDSLWGADHDGDIELTYRPTRRQVFEWAKRRGWTYNPYRLAFLGAAA